MLSGGEIRTSIVCLAILEVCCSSVCLEELDLLNLTSAHTHYLTSQTLNNVKN